MFKNKIIIKFFYLIFIILLVFSIFNVVKWFLENNQTKKQLKEINDTITINDSDGENAEIINSGDIDKSDPYWDYINMSLIDVDFDELKKINPDVVGFIKVNGTNINYPVVQTNDNQYYLTHSFDKSKNSAGWVFMDWRNDITNLGQNNIIYAHGRNDKTMFGTLKNILTNGWLDNTNNYVVKMSSESENTLWQVFSVYRILTTNDYIKVDFSDNEEFKTFLDMIIKRSAFDFKTSVNENDKILTLSTCYNNSDKVVLHAKLIKREKK